MPADVRRVVDRGRVQLFYLSRIMGTSVAMIDATYGHLVPDSEDYLRGLRDTFDRDIAAKAAPRERG